MSSSRQLLLGTGVFLGGGVLLFAMMQQAETSQSDAVSSNSVDVAEYDQIDGDINMLEPLTADIETEERILAEKRRAREKKVAELDKRAKEFLKEQERAEKLAMEKARLESEKYRDNAEPTEVIQVEVADTASEIAKPVVTARDVEPSQVAGNQKTASQPKANEPVVATTEKNEAPSTPQRYIVKRGDGFIKIAKRNHVPLEALLQANKLSASSTIHVGHELTIPSKSQIDRLVREFEAQEKSANTNQAKAIAAKKTQEAKATEKANAERAAKKDAQNAAPTSPTSYQVKRGDGLIKLARQYNVPVGALAEANNMSTNTSLQVGQKLTIPSRRQIARLQREAEQREKAKQDKREAQKRLAEARKKAASGEAKGEFGVQVVLADNQKKADEVVKKLRAAGYPATTSRTSRGVRVIVGPEKGKEAALALKDKINADANVDVNNAWVLYWR